MPDTPRPLGPDDPGLADVLALIRTEFAYMDGVIDPESSMHRLTVDDLAQRAGRVWGIGDPVIACVVLTAKDDALYIGKLAVGQSARGRGLARVLVELADAQARELGLNWLELQVRIELLGNQRAFKALGFHETGRTAHPGYDRPTSITYRRAVTG